MKTHTTSSLRWLHAAAIACVIGLAVGALPTAEARYECGPGYHHQNGNFSGPCVQNSPANLRNNPWTRSHCCWVKRATYPYGMYHRCPCVGPQK